VTAIHDVLAWALALSLCVPGLRGRPLPALIALAAWAALLNVPLGETSPIAVLRGLFAEPAPTTTLVLAGLLLARTGCSCVFRAGEARAIALLAAVTGLLFYPPALGVGATDPYAWGYGGAVLPLLAGALALVALLLGARLLPLALVVALLTWRLGVFDSPNLWDYLIDPLFAIGCLIALVAGVFRPRRAGRDQSDLRYAA